MDLSALAIYIALGFFAQLIDGALGMAYGLISTSVLLATGTSPAIASASIHAAEMVTTGLAAGSHVWNKNVDWRIFRRLVPAGIAGGVVGAYLLTNLPEQPVKYFVVLYLSAMAILILRRLFRGSNTRRARFSVIPIGLGGGFLDALGGGGWGPMVTSTLIARGDEARQSIGSVSASEFFVTLAISVTFIATLDFSRYGEIVLGLIIGGGIAAPFAGFLARILPQRLLIGIVAIIVIMLAIYNFMGLLSPA
ncbi:Sulfite exporter TauE/SafE [Devosia sp. LC5]|uniref:sulfite exporter TauE/SafE family protein n=1 Tax=Devosia sp. LC5 TaxID=1502724 RepID=UPI0004E3C707|nr:sulfite exporter TauE/SafE family protein [Devosia sp. LC5]KFC69755.1 Sulfite exporter TauE/SafE [Devosia sp. LC5]